MNKFEFFAFAVLAPINGVFLAIAAFSLPYTPFGPVALAQSIVSGVLLLSALLLIAGGPVVALKKIGASVK